MTVDIKESMRILKVLMWKHMVVRRRKYINTCIELFLTCIMMVLLYALKVNVIWPALIDIPDTTTAAPITRSAMELDSVVGPERIFYTPDNNVTSSLMSFVGKNLRLKRLNKFPGPTHYGYLAIKNESELAHFYGNLSFFDALVIFHDMDSEILPEKLSYTIRVKSNNFHTGTYEPQSGNEISNPVGNQDVTVVERHELFGTVYEPFLRLQWAVDSSYLRLKTGKLIDKKIVLREMPYTEVPRGLILIQTIMVLLAFLVSLTALMVIYINIITRTVSERAAGVQELMKISGASTVVVYISHCLNSLVTGIPFAIISTIFLSIDEHPIIGNFSPFMLFLTLILYVLTIMAFGLAVGGILNNGTHALSISVVAYSVTIIGALALHGATISNVVLFFLAGLMPHISLLRYFTLSTHALNSWTQWVPVAGNLVMVYVCMVTQIILFFFIAWYLYNVHPGKYGVALPWNFLFMKDYWLRHKRLDDSLIEMDGATVERDPRYFEPIRPDEHVGIRITKLSKIYQSLGKQPFAALNDVNMDVCKAGITVLLGHNGAGKTTLIDIITGMQSATSGEIYVNGHHFMWERAAIRKQLGYCPQHNLLFADLNVIEHIMFFSMLRGESMKGARMEAKKILTDLDLLNRAKAVPAALSGGMSRRLQIGCALAGHTTVLLLDEPTSSLDVRSRRALWDVLLALRGWCTIVISTHFLEEADALGARVCALRRGTLTCDASPLHLKRSIGEGYYITIGGGNEKLEPVILDKMPNAYRHRLTPTSVTYALPHSETSKMSQLFTELEARRAELGIISMGVSPPSLDQVFLKLCYDGTVDSYDEVDRRDFFLGANTKVAARKLWGRQLVVLAKRFLMFMWRSPVMTALYIVMPALITIFIVWCTNEAVSGNSALRSSDPNSLKDAARTVADILNPPRELSLRTYERLPYVKVMYKLNDSLARSLEDFRTGGVHFVRSDDVNEEALRQLKENERNYETNLMGVEINDTTAQFLYSTAYRHIAPVALNLVSNLVARETMTDATDRAVRTVTTFNHPIMTNENHFLRTTLAQPKSRQLLQDFALHLSLVLMVTLMFFNAQLKVESISGARLNYLRAGISHHLYWIGTLLIHLAMFVVVYLPLYIAAVAIFDSDATLTDFVFLASMALILFVSAASVLSFQYFLLIALPSVATIIYYVVLIFYTIFVIPFISQNRIANIESEVKPDWYLWSLESLVWIFPFNHVSLAMSGATYVARLNAYCRLNKGMCPTLTPGDAGFDVEDCCESKGTSYLCYLSSFTMAPRNELLILLALIPLYMVLTIVSSRGVFNRWGEYLRASRYNQHAVSPQHHDDTVTAERDYVVKQMHSVKDAGGSDALLMHNVHKKYHKLCGPGVAALQGINLSVRQGECFGILGVNGAGKTTAFTVIAGEEAPTRGELFVNGHSLRHQRTKYINCVAYCQQYKGVDGFLTGRQCLEYLLTVSGYKPEIVASETKAWLQCVDMERYANRRVSSYSGGCARRLAAAVALCGARPLVLLDEPSSGVDTAARHKLWRAVTRSLGYSAVVLTSHSMDEMEALCARLALVRGGTVHAIGDAHALRTQHAQGHALVLRLSHNASENRDDLVNNLKEDVQQNFDCTLKNDISNQLDYHINRTMSYSAIFTKLETLKRNHPDILDDYCVNDTTLEEVFLAFAAGENVGLKKTA